MKLEVLPANDPRIEEFVDAHRKKFRIPQSAKPAAERWCGIANDDGSLVLVVGERNDPSGYIDVSDMYVSPYLPRPTTARAVYSLFGMYAQRMVMGERFIIRVLGRNKRMRRAIERVFNREPLTVTYCS